MQPVYARVPQISRDPAELFKPTYAEEPLLFKYWTQTILPATVLASSVFTCYVLRMPIRSALPIHASLTALSFLYGVYHEGKYHSRTALKDAAIRDYIRLHPDDFEPEPVRKLADILEPWIPIR